LPRGGYQHHLAANIWSSRGTGPRRDPVTGLEAVELLADAPEAAAIRARIGGEGLCDPRGTLITLGARGA
jgi:catechol 2,3-dioxygenase